MTFGIIKGYQFINGWFFSQGEYTGLNDEKIVTTLFNDIYCFDMDFSLSFCQSRSTGGGQSKDLINSEMKHEHNSFFIGAAYPHR
jgi:hypothetical protein